jgi:class 3 adenylate cyclase
MSEAEARRIVLARHPEGMPTEEDLKMEQVAMPSPAQGQVLLRTIYLSLDPYMRGRMSTAKSYAKGTELGEPITGGTVCEVIESKDASLKPGDIVLATVGWQSHAAVPAKGLIKLDPARAPLTTALGVLGMPGFTAIAESMKDAPQLLTTLVNRLLSPLSQAILDRGGTIDKYIGDCIMAFWNAPLDDPDHAAHAVQSAIAMMEALERLNAELAAEAQAAGGEAAPVFKVGIGINTGACVVGNMGSETRFDYSALGDAVNLASRLESETKSVGVPLLLGPETAAAVAGRFALAELGPVSVKGKALPVTVWTLAAYAPSKRLAG